MVPQIQVYHFFNFLGLNTCQSPSQLLLTGEICFPVEVTFSEQKQ